VIYRVGRHDELLFRDELDELSSRRGAPIHYVIGDRAGNGLLSPEQLRELVPDIAERQVYVCGPPAMVDATRASLGRTGVRHIVTERFAY
jgi:NAD(P)H-flavin reductase